MSNVLISIDWDYFMPYIRTWNVSYLENKKNIDKQWYKIFIKNKLKGIDVTKSMNVGIEIYSFWTKIKKCFRFTDKTIIIVSESHKMSYQIAEENYCREVYSFDAHSDLGYGGIDSLNYELNCANWLGKLLKNSLIDRANIIYSSYSAENPEDFKEINQLYNIVYRSWETLGKNISASIIHICRSGAWTAPWLDDKFFSFIKEAGFKYKVIDCFKRDWNPDKINLSEQIDYMLCG